MRLSRLLYISYFFCFFFFFSSRRRHTSSLRDWSSDVCSSDLRAPRNCTSPRAARAFAANVSVVKCAMNISLPAAKGLGRGVRTTRQIPHFIPPPKRRGSFFSSRCQQFGEMHHAHFQARS